jgi:hypothetical protein
LSADMHRGQRASRGNQANHALKAGYKGAADFFATQHKFFLLPGRHPYKQAMGVHQVGQGIQDLDRNTQQNAALVEETTSAAAALKQQADTLQDEIANFRVV